MSTTSAQLHDRASWPPWFSELKIYAIFKDVWELVSPDAPDAPRPQHPALPMSIDELILVENQRRGAIWRDWEESVDPNKGPRPDGLAVASFNDVKEEHTYRFAEYRASESRWVAKNRGYQAVFEWVRQTVHPDVLEPHTALLTEGDTSRLNIQALVRALKLQYAPTDEAVSEHVREEYRKCLKEARDGVNPRTWLTRWLLALSRAKTRRLPDVEGFLAVKDFLTAVSHKIYPEWATQELRQATAANTMGEPVRTLEEYGRILEALVQQIGGPADRGVYSTFSGQGPKSTIDCPCEQDHHWKPAACHAVELAITGKCSKKFRPELTKSELADIRIRTAYPKYKEARESLVQKYGELASGDGAGDRVVPYPGSITA